MANRVRKQLITFFVDEDEYAAIKLKMQKMGINHAAEELDYLVSLIKSFDEEG